MKPGERAPRRATIWPAFAAMGLLAAMALSAAPDTASAAAATQPATADFGFCRDVELPVALTNSGQASQTVSGTYCCPTTWAAGPHEVDVLTPGATYNRIYWNWPVDPALYSYVDKTLAAGRATFDYDRLGTGESSHPLSLLLTISSEAFVLHQIVRWLRDDVGYDQVNLVGHSLGSVISIQEAGTYSDVDRVVVTGLLHVPQAGIGFAATLASLLHPAIQDAQFTALNLDPGYLTTIPGDRLADFYSSSADPAVIAYDEAHKDLVPATDLATLATTWALPPGLNVSDAITAPVLIVIGADDAIFCTDPPLLDCSDPASLLQSEQAYYAGAASRTLDVIAETGHDVALHPTADQSFDLISNWITTH